MNRSASVVINCSSHYHSVDLQHFMESYRTLHVQLVLFICPLGLLLSGLNVTVLNQRAMRSPTNFLLTLLAVSDSAIMALYVVFALKFLRLHDSQLDYLSWAWVHYLLFYLVMQNVLHSFSSWTVVSLAIFRLIYIRYPHSAVVHCTLSRARLTWALVLVSALCISVPYILAHQVIPLDNDDSHFRIDYTSPAMSTFIHLWTSIFVKSLPITLLTLLTIALISALRHSLTRRRQLLQSATAGSNSTVVMTARQRRGGVTKTTISQLDPVGAKRSIKTTRMLIAIVIMFLISYLPQAIILLMTGLLGHCFSTLVYDKLGDIMDLLTLLNACVNFILLCSMSSQYRHTFIRLFCCNRNDPRSPQGYDSSKIHQPSTSTKSNDRIRINNLNC